MAGECIKNVSLKEGDNAILVRDCLLKECF
jgi:hypothetical protein